MLTSKTKQIKIALKTRERLINAAEKNRATILKIEIGNYRKLSNKGMYALRFFQDREKQSIKHKETFLKEFKEASPNDQVLLVTVLSRSSEKLWQKIYGKLIRQQKIVKLIIQTWEKEDKQENKKEEKL